MNSTEKSAWIIGGCIGGAIVVHAIIPPLITLFKISFNYLAGHGKKKGGSKRSQSNVIDSYYETVTEETLIPDLSEEDEEDVPIEVFIGTYQCTDMGNFNGFLQALDVNFLLRTLAEASMPIMEVSERDGVWTIDTHTPLKSMSMTFRLDQESDETTPDGREVKSIVRKVGNKLISVQTAKNAGDKSTRVVREFIDGKVIQTMEVLGTNISCRQIYVKRVEAKEKKI